FGLARIASPPIGAGAGQLGLADAAELMAGTFEEHCRGGRPDIHLQIVADREDERAIIEAAIQRAGR
ncbi:MAG TPA: hypothetical protein PK948_03600, partial [Gemmatimonadales bacterium]|nr:hypothetical protein [Gemmatimonadales bacterium]